MFCVGSSRSTLCNRNHTNVWWRNMNVFEGKTHLHRVCINWLIDDTQEMKFGKGKRRERSFFSLTVLGGVKIGLDPTGNELNKAILAQSYYFQSTLSASISIMSILDIEFQRPFIFRFLLPNSGIFKSATFNRIFSDLGHHHVVPENSSTPHFCKFLY